MVYNDEWLMKKAMKSDELLRQVEIGELTEEQFLEDLTKYGEDLAKEIEDRLGGETTG